MAKSAAAENSDTTAKPKGKPRGRPFKPGESGNPGGRPKKDRELTAALEAAVDKKALAEKVVALAMAGSETLLKYIYDRIEGSPTQSHKVSYDDVVEEVRQMAKDRGLSPEDTERAVRAAEEMVRGNGDG